MVAESGMVAGISSDADPNKLFQGGGRIGQCSRPPSGTALRAATPTPPPTHCYRGWKEQGLGADDIARVRARVHAATIDVLGPVSDPRTIHRSTSFIGFVLAMIAKKGSAEIDDFTEEALGDSKLRRSIAKVEMVLDPEVDAAYPRRWIGSWG